MSYPRYPTIPPVSGGNPVGGSVCNSARVWASTSSGLPPVGTPSGGVPSQHASPPCSVSTAAELTPTNDHRDHDLPVSADSKRKVPVRFAASVA